MLVLDKISFEVKAGKILALVGKSGIGKSTLLNIIGGLEQATAGRVDVHGSIGYVPQEDMLLPWRSVIANVILPVEIRKGDLEMAVITAREFLRQYELGTFETAYPSEISGGMRQKVSLIRTLLQDPQIILLDEPFSAIDFDTRLHLVQDIRSYVISTKKAAVFVTHNIEEAITISDTVIVLGGRPAHSVWQTDISIPDGCRDPVTTRRSKDFQAYFEQIWKSMGASV